MERQGDAQTAFDGFTLLLEFLLDSIVLELDGDDLPVAIGDGIEASGGLFWIEDNKLGEHQVTERADIVFVLETSNNAVIEVDDVEAGESCFHKRVEGLIGTLFDKLVLDITTT